MSDGHRCDCRHEDHGAENLYACQTETTIRLNGVFRGSFLCDGCEAHPARPAVQKPTVDVSSVTGIWDLAEVVTEAIVKAHGPVMGPKLSNRFLTEFILHSGDTEFIVALAEQFVVTVDN